MQLLSRDGYQVLNLSESEKKIFQSSARIRLSDGLFVVPVWTGADFCIVEPVTGVVVHKSRDWLRERKFLEKSFKVLRNLAEVIKTIVTTEDESALFSTLEKDVEGLRSWIISRGFLA